MDLNERKYVNLYLGKGLGTVKYSIALRLEIKSGTLFLSRATNNILFGLEDNFSRKRKS